MTKSNRCSMICLLAFAVLTLAPNSLAQNRPPVLEQIAKTYGVDSFGQIEAIRYTWNGDITGLFKASHVWEWEPKTGKISYEGTDKDGKPVKVTYLQSQLNSQPANVRDQIEPSFVNDNYWLLFPLHAYWDTSATVTDQGMQNCRLATGSARLVSGEWSRPLRRVVTRRGTPGSSTSAKITGSCNLSTTVAGPSRRNSSPRRGQVTRRQVLCCSQRSTVAPPMASPCTYS